MHRLSEFLLQYKDRMSNVSSYASIESLSFWSVFKYLTGIYLLVYSVIFFVLVFIILIHLIYNPSIGEIMRSSLTSTFPEISYTIQNGLLSADQPGPVQIDIPYPFDQFLYINHSHLLTIDPDSTIEEFEALDTSVLINATSITYFSEGVKRIIFIDNLKGPFYVSLNPLASLTNVLFNYHDIIFYVILIIVGLITIFFLSIYKAVVTAFTGFLLSVALWVIIRSLNVIIPFFKIYYTLLFTFAMKLTILLVFYLYTPVIGIPADLFEIGYFSYIPALLHIFFAFVIFYSLGYFRLQFDAMKKRLTLLKARFIK